jgi:hypothetical protein
MSRAIHLQEFAANALDRLLVHLPLPHLAVAYIDLTCCLVDLHGDQFEYTCLDQQSQAIFFGRLQLFDEFVQTVPGAAKETGENGEHFKFIGILRIELKFLLAAGAKSLIGEYINVSEEFMIALDSCFLH